MAATATVAQAAPTPPPELCQSRASARISTNLIQSGDSAVFTVELKDCTGKPAVGDAVALTLASAPPGCDATFDPPNAITGKDGVASARVALAADCPGPYDLSGTARGVTVHAVLLQAAAPVAGEGAPADQPYARSLQPVPLALISLGLLFIGWGAQKLAERR